MVCTASFLRQAIFVVSLSLLWLSVVLFPTSVDIRHYYQAHEVGAFLVRSIT
jgi:hypothetical protein